MPPRILGASCPRLLGAGVFEVRHEAPRTPRRLLFANSIYERSYIRGASAPGSSSRAPLWCAGSGKEAVADPRRHAGAGSAGVEALVPVLPNRCPLPGQLVLSSAAGACSACLTARCHAGHSTTTTSRVHRPAMLSSTGWPVCRLALALQSLARAMSAHIARVGDKVEC